MAHYLFFNDLASAGVTETLSSVDRSDKNDKHTELVHRNWIAESVSQSESGGQLFAKSPTPAIAQLADKLFVAPRPHRRPASLFFRLMPLVVEHPHFGAMRAFAFLPADLFDTLRLSAGRAALLGVDLIE